MQACSTELLQRRSPTRRNHPQSLRGLSSGNYPDRLLDLSTHCSRSARVCATITRQYKPLDKITQKDDVADVDEGDEGKDSLNSEVSTPHPHG